MSALFERENQRNVTQKFLLTPKQPKCKVKETFYRTSLFYVNKKENCFYPKECKLGLGHYIGLEFKVIEKISIDLASMVD
jgi:hypothetical protein